MEKNESKRGKGQPEAVVMALRALGGKGRLCDIQRLALCMPDADWSGTQNPKANIRRIVRQMPQQIRPMAGCAEWYELVSLAEELEQKEEHIAHLEEELKAWRSVPTADDFAIRLVRTTLDIFRFHPDNVKAVRLILNELRRDKEKAILDEWLSNKEEARDKILERLAARLEETPGNTYNVYGSYIEREYNIGTTSPQQQPR